MSLGKQLQNLNVLFSHPLQTEIVSLSLEKLCWSLNSSYRASIYGIYDGRRVDMTTSDLVSKEEVQLNQIIPSGVWESGHKLEINPVMQA